MKKKKIKKKNSKKATRRDTPFYSFFFYFLLSRGGVLINMKKIFIARTWGITLLDEFKDLTFYWVI